MPGCVPALGRRSPGRGRSGRDLPLKCGCAFVGVVFYDGYGQLRNPLDAAEEGALGGVAERERDTLGAGPGGPPDTVDVALGDIGQLIVDDVAHAGNVDAARGNVGGDKDAGAPVSEPREGALAGVLALVAVYGLGREARFFELLGEAACAPLRAHEDDHAAHAGVLEEVGQEGTLVCRVDEEDALFDLLDGDGSRGDLDADGIAQNLPGQARDVGGHGRRKKHGLPLCGQGSDDLPHISQEAHVEHQVGLVQDEVRDLAETGVALFFQIEQAPWRGYEDVHPDGEGADLGMLAHSAQDDGVAQREVPPVGAEALPDLEGELARWRQNEGAQCGSPAVSAAAPSFAAGVFCVAGAVGEKMLQYGQGEGGGLPRAGLGDTEQILSGEELRDGLILDRGRVGVVLCEKGTLKRPGHAEIGKRTLSHVNELPSARIRRPIGRTYASWRVPLSTRIWRKPEGS